MGTKYTDESIVGYNATPPSDDGALTESNRLSWAKHKTKLSDPIKTALESINSKLINQFDESIKDVTTGYTTIAGDYKRIINITGAGTVDLGDAATLALGYIVNITNSHTANITVGRNTGTDTINGNAADVTLAPNQSATFIVNSTENGYKMINNSASAIFPSGTSMLFQQTTAPLGWTKQTTHDDKALRVVSGTVGSGGTVAFSTVFGRTATDGHSLVVAELPAHNHGGGVHNHSASSAEENSSGTGGNRFAHSTRTQSDTQVTNNSGTIIGTDGSDAPHSHNIDLQVQYVDLIICNKD